MCIEHTQLCKQQSSPFQNNLYIRQTTDKTYVSLSISGYFNANKIR